MSALHSIPLSILDDLGSRFIINIPEEERKDIIRIMFQVREGLQSPCLAVPVNFSPQLLHFFCRK